MPRRARLFTALVAALLICGGTCSGSSGEQSDAERKAVLGAVEEIKAGAQFLQ